MYLYVSRGFVVALQALSLVIAALLLSAGDYGHFVFLWATTVFLSSVASLGFYQFVLREMSSATVSSISGLRPSQFIMLGVVAPTLLLILAYCILNVVTTVDMHKIEKLSPYGGIVFFNAMVLHLMTLVSAPIRIRVGANVAMLYKDALPNVLMLSSVFLLVRYGNEENTLRDILYFFGFISTVILLVTSIALMVKGHFSGLMNKDSKSRYSLSFWWSALLFSATTQADILIGGIYLTNEQLGVYNILRRITNLISMPQVVSNWSIVVDVAKNFTQRRKTRLQELAKFGLQIALIPSIVITLVVAISTPYVFMKFNIELVSSNFVILCVLLIGSLFNVLVGANYLFATQCHSEHIAVYARVVNLFLMITPLLMFSHSLDGMRLAFCVVMGQAVSNLIVWFYIKNEIGVDTSVTLYCRSENYS